MTTVLVTKRWHLQEGRRLCAHRTCSLPDFKSADTAAASPYSTPSHPQSNQEKGFPCLLNFAFVGILELTFYFTVQNVLMSSHTGSQ